MVYSPFYIHQFSFLMPNINLKMPPKIFGLFTTTSFIKTPPYDLQRAAPQITRETASNTIITFSGRIKDIKSPKPKAIKIMPFEPPRFLPIIIPPADVFTTLYARGIFLLHFSFYYNQGTRLNGNLANIFDYIITCAQSTVKWVESVIPQRIMKSLFSNTKGSAAISKN